MRVRTYHLDGSLGADVELSRDDPLQLRLDSAPVLAISLWGAIVGLTIPNRLADTTVRCVLTHYELTEGHNVLKSGPSANRGEITARQALNGL
jgi:hypothetical protein